LRTPVAPIASSGAPLALAPEQLLALSVFLELGEDVRVPFHQAPERALHDLEPAVQARTDAAAGCSLADLGEHLDDLAGELHLLAHRVLVAVPAVLHAAIAVADAAGH
jgi:hypothetical protein